MKVAPLITVALILCIAFPGPIQAKKKFCMGKNGNKYAVGNGYDDKEGEVCIRYKCVKKKKKVIMKEMKCNLSCTSTQSTLSSNGFKYHKTKLKNDITKMEVVQKISKSSCIQGFSFGFKGPGAWVDRGCRAKFRFSFCESGIGTTLQPVTCPPVPTCPATPSFPTVPEQTTCPEKTCPPIPTCPTNTCPPSPTSPTNGEIPTTTAITAEFYGDWSSWSNWTKCSATCGIGSKTRTRTCLQEPCRTFEQTEQTSYCKLPACGEFGTQQKCFLNDTDIKTLLNIGRNHMFQHDKPEWKILNDGRHLLETKNTRPSVGLSNLGPEGDISKPVSFSGRIYSTDTDNDVIGLVFGFSNERNLFVIASAQQSPGPTPWYVGRLHATCGESCKSSTTISDAIWQPTLHPNDITVLSTGSDYWHNGKKYNFTTCFDPSKLLLSVNITDVTDEDNVESVLDSGVISAKTNNATVDEVSRLGGYVGVYVDSQRNTNWDNLHCHNCNLSIV